MLVVLLISRKYTEHFLWGVSFMRQPIKSKDHCWALLFSLRHREGTVHADCQVQGWSLVGLTGREGQEGVTCR